MRSKLEILNAILIGIAISLFPIFFQEARAAIHASLLISIVLTVMQFKNKEKFKFENKTLIVALLIYSLSLLLGYIFHPSTSALHKFEISIYIFLYALFIPMHINLFNIKHYTYAIFSSAAITLIYLLIYYDFSTFKRLSLATNAINIYATIAASMVAICLHLATKVNKSHKFLLLISALIYILALAITQTRGAWLALIAFLIMSLIFNEKLRKPSIIILAIIVAILPFNNATQKRISSVKYELDAYFIHNKSTSIGQRLDMWFNTLIAIKEKPIKGYGDSSLDKRFKNLSSDNTKPLRWHPHAHNDFLEAWNSFGIFSFFSNDIIIFQFIIS